MLVHRYHIIQKFQPNDFIHRCIRRDGSRIEFKYGLNRGDHVAAFQLLSQRQRLHEPVITRNGSGAKLIIEGLEIDRLDSVIGFAVKYVLATCLKVVPVYANELALAKYLEWRTNPEVLPFPFPIYSRLYVTMQGEEKDQYYNIVRLQSCL